MAEESDEEKWQRLNRRSKELARKENTTLAEEKERSKIYKEMDSLRRAEEEAKEEGEEKEGERNTSDKKTSSAPASRPASRPLPGGEGSWFGFIFILLGLVQFVLRRNQTELNAGVFFLSLVLFVLAGYALAAKLDTQRWAILLPMLLFAIWYFYYKANVQSQFLITYLLVCGVILLVPNLFSKGESVKPELLGFLPVLFLFLDIGMLPFLIEKLQLTTTPLLQGLVLWMPWWMLFGLLTLPSEPTSSGFFNVLLNLLRIGGVMYVMFILVAPAIPNVGKVQDLVPGAGELEAAQLRVREQLPKTENPFFSNMACLLGGHSTDMSACVQERQDRSEVAYLCGTIREYVQGTKKYAQCFEEELEKKHNPAAQVGGTRDPRIKLPTSVLLAINPKALPAYTGEQLPFPFELRVVNPREQDITIEVSCRFVHKGGNQEIPGMIQGQNPATFRENPFITTYLCTPQNPLEPGKYTFVAEATLHHLKTISRLQRAFIGDKTPQEKERLWNEEISRIITIPVSQAPSDLAHLNFDIGHALGEIIVENKPYRQIVVQSNIEAQSQGKLLQVEEYSLGLGGFSPDIGACAQGNLGNVTQYQGKIPLPSCRLSLPPEFADPEDWLPYEFEAYIIYDYQVSARQEVQLFDPSGVIAS